MFGAAGGCNEWDEPGKNSDTSTGDKEMLSQGGEDAFPFNLTSFSQLTVLSFSCKSVMCDK